MTVTKVERAEDQYAISMRIEMKFLSPVRQSLSHAPAEAITD